MLSKFNRVRLLPLSNHCSRLSSLADCQTTNKQDSLSLQPPKGFRDFYPEDQQLKLWLHDKWKCTSRQFGFEQIDTPIVEYGDMYDRNLLEDINQQIYTFKDSSKGHPMQLRAEMTPSLVRAVVAHHPKATYPLKWFSIPQCWSHDVSGAQTDVSTCEGNNTDGSDALMREHYQWNMDVWGVAGVEAEAELLSSAVAALTSMGLTHRDVVFKISSRKIINELMASKGIPREQWPSVCLLLDKADRISPDDLQRHLQSLGVSLPQFEESRSALSSSNDIAHFASKLGPASEGVSDVVRLLELLELYGLSEWVQFDASVVRGLAYYSGVVFETFDRQGQFRAICGGGRYDDMLLPMFRVHGEYPTKAAGFGMSDRAVEALLKRRGLLPAPSVARVDVMLIATGAEKNERRAYHTASSLRDAGLSVDFLTGGSTSSSQAARFVVRVNGDGIVVTDTVSGKHTNVGESESVADVVGKLLLERTSC